MYSINVQELHEYIIVVEALNREEALTKALEVYNNEKDKYQPNINGYTQSLIPMNEWPVEEI